MDQKIKNIQQKLLKELSLTKNITQLETLSVNYLGRKGAVNQLFQSLSSTENVFTELSVTA